MGYVVVRRGPTSERDYRDYVLVVSRHLLHRGAGLDRLPLLPADGRPDCWLYVSDDEAEAQELAQKVKRYTEDDGWEVRPAEATPRSGPLPLVLELGRSATSVGFGLDPISASALRLRYPGSARHQDIWLNTHRENQPSSIEELRRFAAQLLPVLAGLTTEQLAVFGGFEIVNPVTQEVIVPFTPLLPLNGEGQPAGSPRHPDSAASPDHCTAPSAG
jgi:hypothetical protein